jgi:hypothetical protein
MTMTQNITLPPRRGGTVLPALLLLAAVLAQLAVLVIAVRAVR